MNDSLPILGDAEVRRFLSDEEAGFGALSTPRGLLPLQAMDVQTHIDGLLARTTVAQTFVNTLGEPLEATYIFPLPDRAGVTHFRMEVSGRVIEGELKERGAARRDYDQAVRAGQRAAISEEERPGVFTLRVGNLMPGEQATIRLTMTGPLLYSDGEATFRFPLVVAPRYIPGNPLPGRSVGDGAALDTDAVPDASRITPPVLLPGFPNPVRLTLAVEIHPAGMPLADFRSSLHAVAVEESENSRRIVLQPGERLNRDFILRFRVGEEKLHTSLTLQPDAEGQEGTFLLTLVPPAGPAHQPKPRDVVFILDRSGSMGGWKMVAARRALARMVDTLTDRDRFTVYAFDDHIETPVSFSVKNLMPATDRNRFRAVEFLAGVDARGGTELAQPLDQAVQQLSAGDGERDRILVLVTDGQVGNEDQILRNLGKQVQNLRIFTLGIDQAVNEGFLKRLACLGGGCSEVVESEDRLDAVMDKIHRRIGTPVLTGLRLVPADLEIRQPTLTPSRLPDLFAGAPLFLMGRYCGTAKGSIALKAQDPAGRAWSENVPAALGSDSAVATVWARGHIRELEDRYAAGGSDRDKLEKQIVQTSLRFGVLCRFTAYVAVDVKEVINPGGQVHRVTQPVEPAAGWRMLGMDVDYDECATVAAGARVMSKLCRHSLPPASASSPPRSAGSLWRSANMAAMPVQSKMAPESGRSKKEGGILQSLYGYFAGKETPPDSDSAPFDLTAYRRRASELRQRLQAASPADRLTALGVLAVQLSALIEDLETVVVYDPAIQALKDFLKDLQTLLARTRPGAADVDDLWARAEKVLKDFGAEAATPVEGRREGFWK